MTDKHTLAPPELAERALVEELATQMALAAGYAPHCWPTWEQEATVIIPTIAKHMATRITALEAREAELVEALATRDDRVKRCPINRRWLSEAERAKCSKCGATPSESCGETSLADAQFVEIARATLTKHQEGEGNA